MTLDELLQWLIANNPARVQNEQLGDMEFQQAVAPLLDPKDRHLVDPAIAKIAPVSSAGTKYLTLQGVNTTQSGEPFTIPTLPYEHLQGKDAITLLTGLVYAMGAENAHPSLWAHEFRHGAPSVQAKGFVDPIYGAERQNRYEDVFHAITAHEKEAARQGVADMMFSTQRRPHTSQEVDAEIAKILDIMINEHMARDE